MSWFSKLNFAGLLKTVVLGVIGGAVTSLGTGHFNPVAISGAALLGGTAAAVGFVQDPVLPPTTAELVAAATTAATTAANLEINRVVPGLLATPARHLVDAALDKVAVQIEGPATVVKSAVPFAPPIPNGPAAIVAALKLPVPPPPPAPTRSKQIADQIVSLQAELANQPISERVNAAVSDGPPTDSPPAWSLTGAPA